MKTRLTILFIILFSAGLRIYDIEQKNLWFDEVYSWKITQGSIVEIVSETSGDIHPPLFYIILKFWISVFSDSVFSMRMLSVLLSVLSFYLLYKLAAFFLEKDLQIILVLLLYAVSPLNIYYSQEVRMLNLNLFLCLGSVYYFMIFLNTGSKKTGIIYLLFTTLALYTHYFAFLILITEFILIFIFYFFQKTDRKILLKYLLYFLSINVLYFPWYPVFFIQTMKGQPWRTSQSAPAVATNVLDYFKDIFLSTYYTFESKALYYFSNFLSYFILAFIFFSIFKIINSKTFLTNRKNFIIFFFCVPLIITVIISFRQSIVMSRYLSIIVPFFFIMIVYLSFRVYNSRTAVLICTFLIASSCYGTCIYFENDFKNNDYRKIISYLENNFEPQDEIIVEPHFMGWSLNYYIKNNKTNLKSPDVLGWNMNMQLDSVSKMNDFKKIWFIVDYSALDITNYDSLTSQMYQLGYKKSKEKSFYIIPAKVKIEYFIKEG